MDNIAPPDINAPEPAEDPISDAQNAVFEAHALLCCLATEIARIEYRSFGPNAPDMLAACSGIIRLLDKIGDDLDPRTFRRAVLASEQTGEAA